MSGNEMTFNYSPERLKRNGELDAFLCLPLPFFLMEKRDYFLGNKVMIRNRRNETE
jgi:hypothetical protein